MFKFSLLTAVHQNSTYGAVENVGTATKPNGIMHEPVRADRHNAFSNKSSSVLFCIQTAVDIPSQTSGPSTFELPDHALVGPGREGGVRVGESPHCWGVNYRYFGQCISYAVVASVLLGDAISCSTSSSEGCGSSVKCSSSADDGHLGNATVPCTGDGSTCNNIEGINSDKSIDSGRPSLALCSSSCRSVVQEPEVGSSYVDRNLEHNCSLVVCSSSCLRSQGGDSSTSTSANQQILDLNLALAFQETLSDPRITSMLKRKGRHTDRELANLLQDKGLDPNFPVMLKENGLDPMILDLLQRSITTTRLLERQNGEFLMKSSSETTTTQDAVVYGDGFSSENREVKIILQIPMSGLERKGGDSSTSTSANQQILDLNLALAFQENLSDPRITSILKRKERHTDREFANLLQDKGLDLNFAIMLKENGLDPMILALLQRSSLDADREHRDSNPPVTDSNNVENVLPNHNLFSEELRLQ
ncbi:hypothetical protein T459_28846 [Capsicum annuum]|uniref:Calpain-type cysteine protease DEK1 n=1 Tax=Capsicum annuum TaxID=4072 RepID=A0A2G2YI24_CAPAN|nr:hypothetical protein T459_28846 [Capsicum annuum]